VSKQLYRYLTWKEEQKACFCGMLAQTVLNTNCYQLRLGSVPVNVK